MPRIRLRTYRDPGRVEGFVNIRRKDGLFETLAAVIDTGAAVSLLPEDLLPDLDHHPTLRGKFIVEQAGIAGQTFEALEATVSLFFEDATGARTTTLETPVWFAKTDVSLIGFAGVLDRATLHIDLRTPQHSWLEIDE